MKKINRQQVYIQLAPRKNWSSENDRDLQIVTAGVNRPERRVADSILVKVVLTIPAEAFDPITVAAIDVPLSDIERPVVQVADANA